ncbi:MAG: hypothetical protein ABJN26_25225 [Stappiaceae bacterium]
MPLKICFFVCLSLFGLMAQAAAQKLNPTKSEINAFVVADKNEDRVLSKSEFKTFVKAMAAAGQSTARKIRFFGAYGYAFSIVDKNADGIVSPNELRSADDDFRAKN